MKLDTSDVLELLRQRGVDSIYHANSVITSCQFLRESALLSRGYIQKQDWLQTPQDSDVQDKIFQVWNDVFCDSVDIHDRVRRANKYGPVLLEIDVEILATVDSVWVTKRNPMYWGGLDDDQRWFASVDELRSKFVKGRFDQMVVFRDVAGRLPLDGFLQRVTLDDPNRKTSGKVDWYSMAWGALQLAITDGGLTAKVCRRKCSDKCTCRDDYRGNQIRNATKMFFPYMK